MSDKIKSILNRWRSHPSIAENVVAWRVLAPKPAETATFPENISPLLVDYLQTEGIHSLYTQQAITYEKILSGYNVAVVSGTASGKTLCYNLPVLDRILKEPETWTFQV